MPLTDDSLVKLISFRTLKQEGELGAHQFLVHWLTYFVATALYGRYTVKMVNF